MEIRLDGKVALVTGGSRGIGLAIGETMAAAGARVMLSSRKAEDLERAASAITRATSAEVGWFAANAGDPVAAEAGVAATIERFGAVDVLVNNAATNPYFGPAIDIDLGRWDKTWDVNLRGLHAWTQAAWRAHMATHGGNVINLASIGGYSVEAGIGVYNTTKAAVIHLTKVLAAELAPSVRVNGIAPGLVKTDMARALWESNERAVAEQVPLKRLGEPVDIANAAVFLASDSAGWITGTTVVVDGGMLL